MNYQHPLCLSSSSKARAVGVIFAVSAGMVTLMPCVLAAQQKADAPPAGPPRQQQQQTQQPKPKTHAEAHAEAVANAQSPKARYTREVEGQIGKLWHIYSSLRRDAGPGRVELSIYVTKRGKVEGIVIQDQKQSNAVLTEFTLRAVRDAKLPPMPKELYAELPELDPERLRFDFKFIIAPPDPEEKPKGPAKEDRPKTGAIPNAMPTSTVQMPDLERAGESWQQWLAGQKPLKAYYSQVGDLLAAGWKRHLAAHRASLPAGQVRMSFRVKPDGAVDEVLILDKDAPIRLKNAGLATIRGVQFPPMAARAAALFAGRPAAFQGVRVPCTFSVGHPE